MIYACVHKERKEHTLVICLVRNHAANAEHMQEEVLFTINWRNDVTTAHVIRYNDVLWNITRVDTFEGYKEDISLYCNRR